MVAALRARIKFDYARWLRRSGIIEQQQLHPARPPREHAEIGPLRKDGGAQREAATRLVEGHLFAAGKASSRDIARAGQSDTSAKLRVQIGRGHEPIFTHGDLWESQHPQSAHSHSAIADILKCAPRSAANAATRLDLC
jgi:hypothetical protein